MEIFPAIDVMGGKVVRLVEGDFSRAKEYGEDPVAQAEAFLSQGARNLHAVDLDGARGGAPANFGAVRAMCGVPGLFVEVGGGVRDEATLEAYLEAGAGRVVIGTAALEDFAFVERMAARHGARVAVGVDARGGKARARGWTEGTAVDAFRFCERLRDAGVRTVVYTEISRDGTLAGADMAAYRRLAGLAPLQVVASGGIASEREIAELRAIGVHAAILGKALYERKITLEGALAAAGGRPRA
jgi:phosphoribosylformimino-5-aminoimidazole carboxamide ribotide isomerase